MSDCNCNNVVYASYTNNTSISSNCGHQQACNSCIDIIKSECIVYTGSNLTNLLVDRNDTLSEILAQLDSNKQAQDLKNTAILAALNDINDRLNVLEDADHPPYTLV